MEKLLTIVVPAYNVEKYIKNCLDSFIDLSVLRSLEILIVDDGSTDSTASLAHTYEQKYPYSFKVLSKENGGHGSTINYAIPRATGKYFKVVDGDDWLDKSLLPQFVQLLKHTHSMSYPMTSTWWMIGQRRSQSAERQCPTLITTTGSGALLRQSWTR